MSRKVYVKSINTRKISRVSIEEFYKMRVSGEWQSAGNLERKYNEFLKLGMIYPLEQAIHLLAREDPDDPHWGPNFLNRRTPEFKKIYKVLDEAYRHGQISLIEIKSINGPILGVENIELIRWAITKEFGTRLPEVFIEFASEYPTNDKALVLINNRAELDILGNGNSFIKQGKGYAIKYKKFELFYLPLSIGLKCIELLIKNPGKKISVNELDLHCNPRVIVDSIAADKLDGLQQGYDTANSSPVYDRSTFHSISNRNSYLEEEIEKAKMAYDIERQEEFEEELQRNKHYLSAGSYDGKIKTFTGDTEKRRQNFTRAINRAIDTLGEHCLDLKIHFEDSISTGFSCSYEPKDSIKW